MDSKEQRILKVSEMISERIMDSIRDFSLETDGSVTNKALAWAMYILAPEIQDKLEPAMDRVIKKNGLDDTLISHVKVVQMETGYTIGIIAGLHLAGRPDLVAKFAKLYGQKEAFCDYLTEYDDRGHNVRDNASKH
jgi:hypothetical protein